MNKPQDEEPQGPEPFAVRALEVLITFLLALGFTGPLFLFFAWATPEPDTAPSAAIALAMAVVMTLTRRWKPSTSPLLKHLTAGPVMAFLGCYVLVQMGLMLTGWSWVVGDGVTRRPAVLLPLVPATAAAVLWPVLRRRFGGRKEE
jgi:Na+/H+ antiporter NhaD/arsenite permease-like protein